MQILGPHLSRTYSSKVLLLKPGVGQDKAVYAMPTARNFCLVNFYLPCPFTFIFSQTPLEFFLSKLWLMQVPVWARRMK